MGAADEIQAGDRESPELKDEESHPVISQPPPVEGPEVDAENQTGEDTGEQEADQSQPTATLSFTFRGDPFLYDWDADRTIADFAEDMAEFLEMDVSKVKLFITPKPGLLKYPHPHDHLSDILSLVGPSKNKIQVLGTTNKEIKGLNRVVARSLRGRLRGGSGAPQASKYRDSRKIQEEARYTFHMIRPLQYLPKPERSARFLEQLRDDPGIKAAMRAHKFSVPLLTEMNPAEHTTHESRTLGLNRNKGEVIELRLRTDAYDGYRDYKVIRKTLCHELAHCVWGDHDRNFWNLTNQIEKEVERADWKHGGNKLSNDEFYNPDDAGTADDHLDHGGWTGGEFILGSSSSAEGNEGLSRRDILAKAAMSRMEKKKEAPTSGDVAEKESASGSSGS